MDDLGIGAVLMQNLLSVPPNQREYRWEEKNVIDLFQDLRKAIDGTGAYFLGTIALTGADNNRPEVTDGQQRLATITILLAAFRDFFADNNEEFTARWVEETFLTVSDPDAQKRVPRLALNFDDREFFAAYVATRPQDKERAKKIRHQSNARIQDAIEISKAHVTDVLAGIRKPADKVAKLRRWIDFIRDEAIVIVLRLTDDLNAFRMFATLNDRGVRTTQFDIVKNYLFEKAGSKMHLAQPLWSRMSGVLESLEADDIALTYLRHFIITKDGPSREAELFDKVEQLVPNKHTPIAFITELDEAALDYVAILTPDDKKWNQEYNQTIRESIRTLRELRVVQIRPLMLAVARAFDPQEAAKAFRVLVSWSVRFLISGGGRAGTIEEAYGKRAKEVTSGTITTAKELAIKMLEFIPSDIQFEADFAVARVSKNYLARYYLRAMEMCLKDSPDPEWVPNDGDAINLEHILPENPNSNWPDFDADTAKAFHVRIGNMVLLQAKKNVIVANAAFADKRSVLQASTYLLTKEAGKQKAWTVKEIADRQKRLAAIAVKTWPLKVR